jgi:endonuclease YncB( thermonuclease family)
MMSPRPALRIFLLALAVLPLPAGGGAVERIHGPIEAEILRIKDGDTIEVRAHIWPGQYVEVSVRLSGIDTPELRGKCEEERRLAGIARDSLNRWLASGRVLLRDVTYDKYGGRAVASVETDSGEDIASRLLAANLARRYGGRRKQGWCDTPGD